MHKAKSEVSLYTHISIKYVNNGQAVFNSFWDRFMLNIKCVLNQHKFVCLMLGFAVTDVATHILLMTSCLTHSLWGRAVMFKKITSLQPP